MKRQRKFLALLLAGGMNLGFLIGLTAQEKVTEHPVTASQPVKHVIHISVDALGAKYLEKFIQESPEEFNNFKRMIDEGASTLNARTDFTHTITLPNHTCMVTGRPVLTPEKWAEAGGHFWKLNVFSDKSVALGKEGKKGGTPENLDGANPTQEHISSSFEVAHDHGLSTALYSGKSKFALFSVSYGEQFGKENEHGRNKIDHVILEEEIQQPALKSLKKDKPDYVFLHYREPDAAGHKYGYLGDEYRNAVKKVNGYLGELFDLIENDPEWKGQTILILSADHGGKPGTKGHGDSKEPYDYTIPFLVWGSGVAKGVDLYSLNQDTRKNPEGDRPAYASTGQPIRNGDGGNLALKLLGLPAIPGSSINSKQDLQVQ